MCVLLRRIAYPSSYARPTHKHTTTTTTAPTITTAAVLVNNAGVAIRKPVLDFTPAEVRTLFDVNYHGVVAMCDAVLPAMVARRAGRVFNVGSGLGYATVPCMGHYGGERCMYIHTECCLLLRAVLKGGQGGDEWGGVLAKSRLRKIQSRRV